MGIQHPAGLAFSPITGSFFVTRSLDASPGSETDIDLISMMEDRTGTTRIGVGIPDPINMVFDASADRLLFFDTSTNEIVAVGAALNGNLDPQNLVREDATGFGVQNPRGMAVDAASGRLFILDPAARRIVRVEPNPEQGFDGAVVSEIDLSRTGLKDLRGLALHPVTGRLFTLDLSSRELHELTQTGELFTSHDVSGFGFQSPQGMTFGPSGDATDDPDELSLYVADAGTDSETSGGGRIKELSFDLPAVAEASISATVTGTLVQTVNTWQYSPPSPDPAGVTYMNHLQRLLISDSEVNEMSIYAGANLFETNFDGSLYDTYTTLPFSNEPTGLAYNPDNHHLFISDDSERGVFEVDPGPDGLYITSDDIVTVFSTTDFGSADPEGVAYDPIQGFLYVVDGVNAEVYQVTPGANRVFDGVSPGGDDQVSSFDTEGFSLLDPEGIVWDADFGHLYVVGKPATTVFHVSTDGLLLRTIDISAAGADKPAGLAYAPGSQNPNLMNLWIVDRVVDNNNDPSENDGRAYEISMPLLGGNLPPTVDAAPPSSNSTPTLIWNERFEASGTDEIWSEGVDAPASSTLDTDYPVASIAGAPADWGTKAIELNMVAGDGAELEHRFGADLPKTYLRFEFILAEQSFGNNQDGVFVEIMESTIGKNFAKWMIDNSNAGGGLNLEVWIEYDGTPQGFHSAPLSLDTRYVVELYWDTASDLWEYRIDGVTQAGGAITGAATEWELDRVRLGDNGEDTDNDYRVYVDNVLISEVDWSGSTFFVGEPITFSGTATDVEDGDLSASLVWTSNRDGQIGTGASFTTSSLSLGTHTVTASVFDLGGLQGSDAVTLTVSPPTPNQAPTASFTWGATGLT
ncbi:MAG: hypothetical protein ACWGON_03375, partial [Gemmatimonadota bacterium]